MPGVGPADPEHQPIALVVAQRGPGQAGALGPLGDRQFSGRHAPSLALRACSKSNAIAAGRRAWLPQQASHLLDKSPWNTDHAGPLSPMADHDQRKLLTVNTRDLQRIGMRVRNMLNTAIPRVSCQGDIGKVLRYQWPHEDILDALPQPRHPPAHSGQKRIFNRSVAAHKIRPLRLAADSNPDCRPQFWLPRSRYFCAIQACQGVGISVLMLV